MLGIRIEQIEFLLLVAAVVAMVARRLRLPYNVGLVVAGVTLSLIPLAPKIQLSRQLIFIVLLPPLIFEAALYIRWQELRREFPVVLSMASAGVLLSATVTTLGLHYLERWEWPAALLFSMLISATDPVSVIATFKEAGGRGRMRFLLEAESLFNDGTAAVAFAVAITFVSGRSLTTLGIVETTIVTIGGAILCGAAVAATALLLAGRTTDYLVETTLTTTAAYGSFLLAEHFGFSGVLATLTAGVLFGNIGPFGAVSGKGKEAIELFWEYAAFVANSFIFLLIGMNGSKLNIPSIWESALASVALVFLGRAAAVYLTLLPFSRSSLRVSPRHQHILVWCGLRGALALALALGLPAATPRRDEIITVTFVVVIFSVFIQGATIVPLLRRLGELPVSGQQCK